MPWCLADTVEQIPGGYKVLGANGKSLAYVYGREIKADADTARHQGLGRPTSLSCSLGS